MCTVRVCSSIVFRFFIILFGKRKSLFFTQTQTIIKSDVFKKRETWLKNVGGKVVMLFSCFFSVLVSDFFLEALYLSVVFISLEWLGVYKKSVLYLYFFQELNDPFLWKSSLLHAKPFFQGKYILIRFFVFQIWSLSAIAKEEIMEEKGKAILETRAYSWFWKKVIRLLEGFCGYVDDSAYYSLFSITFHYTVSH